MDFSYFLPPQAENDAFPPLETRFCSEFSVSEAKCRRIKSIKSKSDDERLPPQALNLDPAPLRLPPQALNGDLLK